MSPRRYIGVAVLAAVLTLGFYNGARAGEPDPGCVQALTPEAGVVYARHRAGVPSALNRFLIRSEPRYGEQGRWVLLRFLDALEARDYPDKAAAVAAFLGAACALPAIPAAAPVYRSEFDKPKDT